MIFSKKYNIIKIKIMQFTYSNLKAAANNDIKLGSWNDKEVYAISKDELEDAIRWFAYVIYDDNNLLYYDGKVYGQISERGEVNSCQPRTYAVKRTAAPQVESFRGEEAPQETTPTTPSVVGDVQLEIMVEDTLKAARTMTIDSLLEGFNYGLD